METDQEQILRDKEDIQEYLNDWKRSLESEPRHKRQRDTMHLMLSMPASVNQEDVREATRRFAREAFGGNHEYVIALHTDTQNPHCHLTVRCRGHNGQRLNPRKADLQEWREHFAEKLEELGVNATATPRRSRGITRKAKNATLWHVEKDDKTRPARTSRVRALKVREAVTKLTQRASDKPLPDDPWEASAVKRQADIKNAWEQAAKALEKSGHQEDGQLAAQIREFTDRMPSPETENQQIRKELIQRVRKTPEKTVIAEKAAPVTVLPEVSQTISADTPRQKKQRRDLER